MSPKIKMYLIHAVVFLAVFLIARAIAIQLVVDPTMWTTIVPVACAWLLAPKPHVEKTQSGNQYGLRWVFSKKIIQM